jgi:hypothetical protein
MSTFGNNNMAKILEREEAVIWAKTDNFVQDKRHPIMVSILRSVKQEAM